MRLCFAVLFLVLLLGVASAETPFYPEQGQLSDKVVGVSVLAHCPDERMLTEIDAETVRLHADYSQLLQVVGSSLCPATVHGLLFPFIETHTLPDGLTTQVGGAVTVITYFRRQAP